MEEQKTFSKAEKRWIIREIHSGRMTIGEVKTHLKNHFQNPENHFQNPENRFCEANRLRLKHNPIKN